MKRVAAKIRNYGIEKLNESHCPDNPFDLIHEWLLKAIEIEPFEANAMVLATANSKGRPSSRIVLLKEISDDSLIFYTNYNSSKGKDIAENPYVSTTFWWPKCERQLRVSGTAKKISAEQSNAYFAIRSRESKISALASEQSTKVPNRSVLDEKYAKLNDKYQDTNDIPRPDHWGGYAIKAEAIEFWQGGLHRLHDRILYELKENGQWQKSCLSP